MGKIKLNLVSGAVVEKPLINAFKSNNNSYVVLDNEINGSMGLPIILVSKLENNRLVKIIDQGEWQIVKEYLKSIIAGGQVEFIKLANEIEAEDIYYTQLTLPVPSFDALKNAYKIEEEVINENILNINQEPEVSLQNENSFVAPEIPSFAPEVPVMPEVQIPEVENPVISDINKENSIPEVPVMDINIPDSNMFVMPEIPNVVSNENIVVPEISQNEINVANISPVMPNISGSEITSPSVNSLNSGVDEDIFKEQKEAFMQACENMFDALVIKFKKELENRK